MTDWLDDIEAQADETSPYYLPRLIAEIRRLRKALAGAVPAAPLEQLPPHAAEGDVLDREDDIGRIAVSAVRKFCGPASARVLAQRLLGAVPASVAPAYTSGRNESDDSGEGAQRTAQRYLGGVSDD